MSRYLISVVLGGFVTLALAYLMQFLIFSEAIPDAEAAQATPINFLRIERPEDPPPTPGLVDPRDQEFLPPPVFTTNLPTSGAPTMPISLTPADPIGPIEPGVMPRSLTPIYRAEAEYPIRELQRGREGFVVVAFDVNEGGMTENIRVLSSEPPRAFDNAAVRAVSQWRYQPQTDGDGRPITVGGQQARIEFRMPDTEQAAQ